MKFSFIANSLWWLLLWSWVAIWALLHTGCAQIVAPTGGAKDTIPPQVIIEKSTPNLSTNFEAAVIQLTFDEWIVLKSPGTEILVSPPLENPLQIKQSGKKIVINLAEESLRPNATYVFNFGKAIQDFRENNPKTDYRFVFSTGSFIDSLSVSGEVLDVATGKPVKDALVMLYDNLSDTVVRTERPFYFSRTDKTGKFNIPYVKNDTLKVFALVEADGNYLYNAETEQIGFLDEPIVLTDSFQTKLLLQVFLPTPKLRRARNYSKQFGHLKMAFNQVLFDTIQVSVEPSFPTDYIQQIKDTLHFWYADTTRQRDFILTEAKNDLRDTFEVRLPTPAKFFKANKRTRLTIPAAKTMQSVIKHNPNKDIELTFSAPIARLDTSRIFVRQDTVFQRIIPQVIINNNKRILSFQYKWREQMPYEITLLPNAVEDMFGLPNDTIIIKYKTDALANYGNIDVVMENMSADTSYLVELMRGNEVAGQFTMSNQTSAKQTFNALPTGSYSLRVTIDSNGNGRWDTGAYPDRQPEIIITGAAEQLRANWDLELKFTN